MEPGASKARVSNRSVGGRLAGNSFGDRGVLLRAGILVVLGFLFWALAGLLAAFGTALARRQKIFHPTHHAADLARHLARLEGFDQCGHRGTFGHSEGFCQFAYGGGEHGFLVGPNRRKVNVGCPAACTSSQIKRLKFWSFLWRSTEPFFDKLLEEFTDVGVLDLGGKNQTPVKQWTDPSAHNLPMFTGPAGTCAFPTPRALLFGYRH
jgi:hypothetical protein